MHSLLSRFDATPDRATLVIALTSICFGAVPVFARELLVAGIPAEGVALLRYGIVLPLALLALPRRPELWRPALALVGGGVAMGLGWIAYLRVIETVPLASAGVVYLSYPLFVVILARVVLGRPLGARALLAAGLVLGAGTLAMGADAGFSPAWVVRCLPAPVSFALIVVLLAEADPRLSTTQRWGAVGVGAALGLAPMSLAATGTGVALSQPAVWGTILAMVLITTAIPQLLYTRAAIRVGAARAAVAGALELPAMALFAWIAFGEPLTPAALGAGALVAAAVVIAPGVTPRR